MRKMKEFLARFVLFLSGPYIVFRIATPLLRLFLRHRTRSGVSLDKVKSVLIVHLGDMGRIIYTIPFLKEVRRHCPQATLTLITRRGVTPLVDNCPYVDEIIAYDFNESATGWEKLKMRRRALRLGTRHLWSRRFDLALLPRWDGSLEQDRYIAFFSGAAVRLGFYSESQDGNPVVRPEDRLLTRVLTAPNSVHEVERVLELLRELGADAVPSRPEVWQGDRDERVITETFRHNGVTAGTRIVSIGLDGMAKRHLWSLDNYVRLGRWLVQVHGVRVVWLGSVEDKDRSVYLQEVVGRDTIDLVGQLNPRQTVSLIKKSSLFIGGLGCCSRLADACEIPSILICCHPIDGKPFAVDSPERSGPWKSNGIVCQPAHPRRPCTDVCTGHAAHCIHEVSFEQVRTAVETLLPTTRTERLEQTHPTVAPAV